MHFPVCVCVCVCAQTAETILRRSCACKRIYGYCCEWLQTSKKIKNLTFFLREMVPASFNFHYHPLQGLCLFGFCCLCQLSSARAALLLWLILLVVLYSNLRPVQQFARLKSWSCKTGGGRCSLWWEINVTFYFGLITTWDGLRFDYIWWPLLLLGWVGMSGFLLGLSSPSSMLM